MSGLLLFFLGVIVGILLVLLAAFLSADD